MMPKGGKHFMQISCFSRRECMVFNDLRLSPPISCKWGASFFESCLLPLLSSSGLIFLFFCDLAVFVQDQDVHCYCQLLHSLWEQTQLLSLVKCLEAYKAVFLPSSNIFHASRALFSPRFSKMLSSELSRVGEQQSALMKIFVLDGV